MTAAVVDPGVVIATAVRELLDSVRELVSHDTEDPGVLDELGHLLGRARRKVNKAKTPAAPTVQQATRADAVRPAEPTSPSSSSVEPPKRAVTLAIPAPTPTGPARSVTREVPMPQRNDRAEQAAHSPPARKPRRWPFYALVVAFAGVAIMVFLLTRPSSETSGNDQSGTAETTCQDHVKDRLKSPATAQFTGTNTEHAAGETADFYTVSGTVDSQNGFGALLRSTYVCKLTAERDGTWYLLDLSLSGR